MIKMTADKEGIPQCSDDVANRRLALNPDILQVIAGAMEAVSGHDVDTLLQPEMERLVYTALWALQRLHSIARSFNSDYAPSFVQLSQKLKKTMKAFIEEDDDEDMDQD
jgi:hypothetical protein